MDDDARRRILRHPGEDLLEQGALRRIGHLRHSATGPRARVGRRQMALDGQGVEAGHRVPERVPRQGVCRGVDRLDPRPQREQSTGGCLSRSGFQRSKEDPGCPWISSHGEPGREMLVGGVRGVQFRDDPTCSPQPRVRGQPRPAGRMGADLDHGLAGADLGQLLTHPGDVVIHPFSVHGRLSPGPWLVRSARGTTLTGPLVAPARRGGHRSRSCTSRRRDLGDRRLDRRTRRVRARGPRGDRHAR